MKPRPTKCSKTASISFKLTMMFHLTALSEWCINAQKASPERIRAQLFNPIYLFLSQKEEESKWWLRTIILESFSTKMKHWVLQFYYNRAVVDQTCQKWATITGILRPFTSITKTVPANTTCQVFSKTTKINRRLCQWRKIHSLSSELSIRIKCWLIKSIWLISWASTLLE